MRYALATTLVFAGCASVGVTRVKPGPLKPADYPLDVYTQETEIKRRFEVTCILDSRTGTTAFHDKTAAGAIENAKVEARKCGSDAILIVGMDTEGLTAFTWGRGKAIIKGIRYTD